MAGVSRQALSAVESGKSDPSLRVALAIARALGMSVEEIFGPSTPVLTISARPLAPLDRAGVRVAVACVSDTFVALPLTGAATTSNGFRPASGITDGIRNAGEPLPRLSNAEPGKSRSVRAIRLGEPPRTTLVIAGSDPALSLLEVRGRGGTGRRWSRVRARGASLRSGVPSAGDAANRSGDPGASREVAGGPWLAQGAVLAVASRPAARPAGL